MDNADYWAAATAAPLHPVARQAMQAALDDGWSDPARLYSQARKARQLLDAARESLAEQLGTAAQELWLCGSGSSAAWLATSGALAGNARKGTKLVHSAIEHSAVLAAAADHEAGNGLCHSIGVDSAGTVDTTAFVEAVSQPGVALAELVSASHEVGTLQLLDDVSQACRSAGVPLYVDAAASVAYGELPCDWSLLTASARKWGGPAGVGVLAGRTGTRWSAPTGGEHSYNSNIPLVVAAAAALRAHRIELAQHRDRLRALTTRLRDRIAATVPDVEIVGHPTARLPHIVTFSCLYVDAEALMHALSRQGFAVSSGSACTADELQPSHVLAAMGALTHGNVRISLHAGVTEAAVERFLAILPETVAALRADTGVTAL